jgi:hypothetical protein
VFEQIRGAGLGPVRNNGVYPRGSDRQTIHDGRAVDQRRPFNVLAGVHGGAPEQATSAER